MNLSTIASLVLLAAVGSVAYPQYNEDVLPEVPDESFTEVPAPVTHPTPSEDPAQKYFTLAVLREVSEMNALDSLSTASDFSEVFLQDRPEVSLKKAKHAVEMVKHNARAAATQLWSWGGLMKAGKEAAKNLIKKGKEWAVGQAFKACPGIVTTIMGKIKGGIDALLDKAEATCKSEVCNKLPPILSAFSSHCETLCTSAATTVHDKLHKMVHDKLKKMSGAEKDEEVANALCLDAKSYLQGPAPAPAPAPAPKRL
jgi:hypothetical protein